jgi:pheophorbide a oxygenase
MVSSVRGADLLAPLLHAFQFVADIGNHVVLDGDTVHIYQQVRGLHLASGQHLE